MGVSGKVTQTTELAMACDFRIASSKAKFGQPEVGLGITPGFGGTQRLSKLVGKGMAKYLILTADTIDAAEALRIGLVEKVTEPEDLMTVCEEIATKIVSKAPQRAAAGCCGDYNRRDRHRGRPMDGNDQ